MYKRIRKRIWQSFLHGLESTPSTSSSAKVAKEVYGDLVILDYKPKRNASEIIEFLDEFIISQAEPITLIGISIGGFWVKRLAEQYPEKIYELILLNPAIDFGLEYCNISENKNKLSDNIPVSIILNKDDEVIPYHLAEKSLGGRCLLIKNENGKHRFEDKDALLKQLKLISNIMFQ